MQKYRFSDRYANHSAEKAFSAPFETNKNEKGYLVRANTETFANFANER